MSEVEKNMRSHQPLWPHQLYHWMKSRWPIHCNLANSPEANRQCDKEGCSPCTTEVQDQSDGRVVQEKRQARTYNSYGVFAWEMKNNPLFAL